MNSDPLADDRLAEVFASLPLVDVERARANVIRARSHAALARRRDHRSARIAGRAAWARVLEPALVAGLSAVFLVEVVARALSLQGF